MQNLPKILEREPLVDAVFEVRLGGGTLLADILPGFLFHELDPRPKLSRLPAAEIPQPLRANDRALQFAPVLRLDWDHYFIAVGDRSIVISCKLPYPKWPSFKTAILDIMGRIAKLEIPGQVERYSIKYVNLIHAPTLAEQIAKIRMVIELGSMQVREDQVSLQVHRKEHDILHILSVIIGAEGKLPDGRHVHGAVVDIDSIRTVKTLDFATFVGDLESGVEELRQANKAKFFSCLTDEAIEEMGPIYE